MFSSRILICMFSNTAISILAHVLSKYTLQTKMAAPIDRFYGRHELFSCLLYFSVIFDMRAC